MRKIINPSQTDTLSIESLNNRIETLISSIEFGDLSILTTKEAYPNYDQYLPIHGQRNLQKWIEAIKIIYLAQKNGLNRTQAVRQATSNWNVMEVYDFLNWVKFYQEGAHLKYKTAQLWYENGQPGYFLQIKPDPPKPTEPIIDHNAINDAHLDVERQEEKRNLIEKQRQKIIGRLDSAEKLLRSPDGQIFAGKEMESLMEAIYNLKKKVQLVNKLSTSTRLYEDMIVREGNVLRKKGFIKAAEMLYSVAQANNPPPPGTGVPGPINTLPPPTPPNDPSGAGHPGAPGGLPSLGPGMPQPPGSPPTGASETQPNSPAVAGPPRSEIAEVPESPVPKGITQFLEGIETSGKTDSSELSSDDHLEVIDRSSDDLSVDDEDPVMWATASDEQWNNFLTKQGQALPPPAVEEDLPLTTNPAKPKPAIPPPTLDSPTPKKDNIEVADDAPPANEGGVPDAPTSAKDFDHIIDSALANVTVNDIVAKLEDIAKIFKTREIPRQLSLVDMMLDSLGLSTYFPTLSEAINKSLESNNYVASRLEDITSRLRGSITGKDVDLKGESNTSRADGVAQNLQNQNDKDAARKKMKKEQEAAQLEQVPGKESPQIEIGQDLGAPTGPATPKPIIPPGPVG